MFKKVESISSSESKVIRPLLDKRSLVRKGISLVQDLLKRNNSKLTVYICCFVMRKVKVNVQ